MITINRIVVLNTIDTIGTSTTSFAEGRATAIIVMLE